MRDEKPRGRRFASGERSTRPPPNSIHQNTYAHRPAKAGSFFFSSRRRHTRWTGDWSSDVCSSDLLGGLYALEPVEAPADLENAILTATVGAPNWRSLRRWLKGLQSPRVVYSMASVAATLVIILTASGFSLRKPKLADLAPATIFS